MSESVLKNKSFALAVKVVNFYKVLNSERKEFLMSKQILSINWQLHKKNVMKVCID